MTVESVERTTRGARWLMPALLALILALGLASLAIGPAPISFLTAAKALISGENSAGVIVRDIRLPRTLLAILIGGTLGATGAALQGLLRNPLADSSVFGAPQAAALGAVLVLYFGLAGALSFALPLAAILGALVSIGLVVAVAGPVRHHRDRVLAPRLARGPLDGACPPRGALPRHRDGAAADDRAGVARAVARRGDRPEPRRRRRADAARDRRRERRGGRRVRRGRRRDRLRRARGAPSRAAALRLRPGPHAHAGDARGRGASACRRLRGAAHPLRRRGPDRGADRASRRAGVPLDHRPPPRRARGGCRMSAAEVVVRGLTVRLGRREALSGLDLAFRPGELGVVVGPNGAGKTTLLRAIAGLVPPSAGAVVLGDEPVGRMSRVARARRIAYLPQIGGMSWR